MTLYCLLNTKKPKVGRILEVAMEPISVAVWNCVIIQETYYLKR